MFILVLTCDIYFILDSKNTFMLFFLVTVGLELWDDHEKNFDSNEKSLYFKGLLTQGILYKPVRVYFFK